MIVPTLKYLNKLNSEWLPISGLSSGGSSGGSLVTYERPYTLAAPTSTINFVTNPSIALDMYNHDKDYLMIYKDNQLLTRTVDYNLNAEYDSIVKVGVVDWDSGSDWLFVCMANVDHDRDIFKIVFDRWTWTTPVSATTTVPLDLAKYKKETDILQVYYDGNILFPTANYIENELGSEITLNGFTADEGKVFNFIVWKRIRTTIGAEEIRAIPDDSILNVKLGTDLKVGSLAALDALITGNTSVVAALNNLIAQIGNRSDLLTGAKNTIVAALNEIRGVAITNNASIGIMSNLPHSESSLVIAVNNLHDAINSLVSKFEVGSSAWNSVAGTTVQHNFNIIGSYTVWIMPTQDSGGEIGEYWVESKTANSFVVKNTGVEATATFDWLIIK